MSRNTLCRTAVLLLAAACVTPAFAADEPCAPVAKFAPGVISTTTQWEWRLTFTPSGSDAYWATSVGFWPQTREKSVIKTSTLNGNTWSTPQVASFSGQHADFDPFISPDGNTLYFSSMRPIQAGGATNNDMDLWKVERAGNGWGTPVHLGDGPNRDGYDELYASVDNAGNLYFGRVQAPFPNEDVSIFRSRRQSDGTFGPAELVEAVNTPLYWEFNPEISPDGRTLVFTRLNGGFGAGDLWISRQQDGVFGEATNLGACINSASDDFHPTVVWATNTLYWANSSGGKSDFFVTQYNFAAAFAASTALNGAWVNTSFTPFLDGQGMLLEYLPENGTLFAAWFTYEGTQQRWLTAQGPVTGDTAQLEIFETSGGVFNAPSTVQRTKIGTLTLKFTACDTGTATFAIPAEGKTGTFATRRLRSLIAGDGSCG